MVSFHGDAASPDESRSGCRGTAPGGWVGPPSRGEGYHPVLGTGVRLTAMRTALLLLAGLVLALPLGWWALVAWQRAMMYPRPPAPPGGAPGGVEVLALGPRGRVEAWLLPAAEAAAPAPAMLFFHGNGELVDHWVEDFEAVRRWGLHVLLVEYPGYGRSGGRPGERAIERVAGEAWEALAARPEVDERRIVAYGRSLGGAVACRLAGRRPLAALVLESTFVSVPAMARELGFPGWVPVDRFDCEEALAGFDAPTLVLHGARDRIVPPSHGRRLAALARDARLVELPCGHNDCPRSWEEISAFLAPILAPDPAQS